MSREIRLTDGSVTIVDDAWYTVLNGRPWEAYSWPGRTKKYVALRRSGGAICMHRIIALAMHRERVDHINNDSLDNRSSNLRICTEIQNRRNRPKAKLAKATSRFKGVGYVSHKANQKKPWRVKIQANKRVIRLGYYATEIEAALAYNDAARVFFGEFAYLNAV